jgi:hypothetical protein
MGFLPVSVDSVGDVIADELMLTGVYHIIEHSVAVAK